ncbi:MAG: hypothetical protein ACTHQE_08510, partial [Thermomicrobiales bacterium]
RDEEMTIPTLSDQQRRALGRLIWEHIDGVTGNVQTLLHAINRDVVCGVRVVATQEWERANSALRVVQDLARQLEESASGVSTDHLPLRGQVRELAATIERLAPTPAAAATATTATATRTPIC